MNNPHINVHIDDEDVPQPVALVTMGNVTASVPFSREESGALNFCGTRDLSAIGKPGIVFANARALIQAARDEFVGRGYPVFVPTWVDTDR